MRYLILAQSKMTARALGTWLELIGESPLKIENEGECDDPRCILWREPTNSCGDKGILAYENLASRLEAAAAVENGILPLNEVVILVDSIAPDALNPIAEGNHWEGLVAMLILAYPEIHWVFGSLKRSEPSRISDSPLFPLSSHSLLALIANPRRDPLLDPTGLREWIRMKARTVMGGMMCDYIPQRRHRAAAVDEEQAYAYFHGYTAYRFGYRCDVVSSWSLMSYLFGLPKLDSSLPTERFGTPATAVASHGYRILIEDMSLNFADREAHIHLLRLPAREDPEGNCGRAIHLPKLDSTDVREDSSLRLLVTTGQGCAGYSDALGENRRYLRYEKVAGRGQVIFKPAGGMFDLWNEARLFNYAIGGRRRGDAEDFVWPPIERQNSSQAKGERGHGSPGRMTLIAESLLRRACSILNSEGTVLHSIQGSVLATDALELLGGRTPTLATEALTLKHLLEVHIECHFSGVEFHRDMAPRLTELDLEARAIAATFQKGEQENARLNILMRAANRIVTLLRDHNQFDEEQFWMNKARHFHNTLWMRKNPIRFLTAPLLRYLELLLSSFSRFAFVILLWVVGLAALYTAESNHLNWRVGAEKAISSFFSGGEPLSETEKLPPTQSGKVCPTCGATSQAENVSPQYVWITCLAIVAGFFHLGVFIAQLYTIVARK